MPVVAPPPRRPALPAATAARAALPAAPKGGVDTQLRAILGKRVPGHEQEQPLAHADELEETVKQIRSGPHAALAKALSDTELLAVVGYTGGDFQIINSSLWRQSKRDLTTLKPYIGALSSALAKLPSYQGTVYRITYMRDRHALDPGRVVTPQGFTSTSMPGGGSMVSGDVKLIIQSKTGKRIDYFSDAPYESEVLFAPGARFKVVGRGVDADSGLETRTLEEL